MKVIALSCSPSRGRNSDTMLDYFIKGMQEVPGVDVEKIYLSDVPIDYYTYENSKSPAPHEDKFMELTQKLSNGEVGLVIATPSYNFSVPAHLKNFIDRIRFIALDFTKKTKLGQPAPRLRHVKAFFLVTGGTPKWAEFILFFAFPAFWLRSVFLYFGAHVMGAYYSGDIKAFENKRILNICFKKGKRYARKLVTHKKHKILERIFWRPPEVR